MSKKRNRQPDKPEVEKQTEYYKLKTDAINDLVTANEENSPEVSEEELRAYRSGPKLKLADWAKILLIKAWFAGAVCFFIIWGLGSFFADELDLLFVTAIVLGMVTDLLTNNVLRFFERTPGENARWIMVTRRGTVGLFLNIFYGFVVLGLVWGLYNVLNLLAAGLTGQPDRVVLGVEPVFFGVFCMGFDLLLIQLKRGLAGLLHRNTTTS